MRLSFILLAMMLEIFHLTGATPPDARAVRDAPPDVARVSAEVVESAGAGGPGAAPTPLAPLPEDTALRGAYLDAYHILRGDNSCSAFFGGTAASLTVLNRMTSSVTQTTLGEEWVGMRMSGPVTYVRDSRWGLRYRLFERMTINTRGFFYKERLHDSARLVPDGDVLPPRVRETRVVLILHELAHLVEGPDGRWLIPNDGGDRLRSELNTLAVMERCGPQVRSLKHAGAGSPPGACPAGR